MHCLKPFRFAVTGLGLAVALAGCGSASNDGGGAGGSSSGSGGQTTGSGGSGTGSGGNGPGSGGTTELGRHDGLGRLWPGWHQQRRLDGLGRLWPGWRQQRRLDGLGRLWPGRRQQRRLDGLGWLWPGWRQRRIVGDWRRSDRRGNGGGGQGGSGGAGGSSGGTLTLTSPDQMEGAKFGTMFTCAAMNGTFGAGVNPELDWSGVPANTKSFAITFIDTKIGADMAMGQHWAIWNIPPTVVTFPKGTTMLTGDLTGAMQTNKYLAPCPSGNDTYEFTLYALPTDTLSVTGASGSGTANSAGVAKVLAALKLVTPLGTATLHGTSGPMGN